MDVRVELSMTVNGEYISVQDLEKPHLIHLIHHLQADSKALAVELNGEIASRDQWESIELKESDSIELIRFVGGG